MVEREAMRDPAPPIMTGDGKTAVTEMPHQFDLIRRHRALRIGAMVGAGDGFVGRAVAPQIRRDHAEPRCDELWCNYVPAG
jgi:hypothetical protein